MSEVGAVGRRGSSRRLNPDFPRLAAFACAVWWGPLGTHGRCPLEEWSVPRHEDPLFMGFYCLLEAWEIYGKKSDVMELVGVDGGWFG